MKRRITFIQYTNPAYWPPVDHASSILARGGWETLLLGIRAIKNEKLALEPMKNRVVKIFNAPLGGIAGKVGYLAYQLWAAAEIRRFEPSWIYASAPLAAPLALCFNAAGGGVIYHEHDSPNLEGPLVERSIFMKGIYALRQRLARRAQLCVLPNQARADLFESQTQAANVACAWNCPLKTEAVPTRKQKLGQPPVFYYHGNVSAELFPLRILDAAARIQKPYRLWVAGYETAGHEGYKNLLNQKAAGLGLAGRFQTFDGMPRRELLRLMQQADIGLALVSRSSDDVNLKHLAGASNKAFDYLSAGLPALVPDAADWREIFVQTGVARACDPGDTDAIAAGLAWFIDHPEEALAMGERGRQKVLSEWNYERQFEKCLNLLESGGCQ